MIRCLAREAVNDMYLRVRSLPESAAEKGEPTRRKVMNLISEFTLFFPYKYLFIYLSTRLKKKSGFRKRRESGINVLVKSMWR